MQILTVDDVAAKTTLAVTTIWELVKAGVMPQPIPLAGAEGRRRGWIEDEIDDYLRQQAERRNAPPAPVAEGRRRFWEDVKAGRRPHPRTVARLRREAEEAEAAQ